MKRKLRIVITTIALSSLLAMDAGCRNGRVEDTKNDVERCEGLNALSATIDSIAASYPGQIGVGLIVNRRMADKTVTSDTIAVNNLNVYPMMSVFKLHQSLALCKDFDRRGKDLDSILVIDRSELDPHTWSPMLREHHEDILSLPVRELIRYALAESDNNAGNVMFQRLVDTTATDEYIAGLIPRECFKIAYTEAEMSFDHNLAYSNSTSPLGAAMLINKLFHDRLFDTQKQDYIIDVMTTCRTGKDRIVAPLSGYEDVRVAHKTGSGYVNEKGQLVAHNDVAYVVLPNDVEYALALFVKDFEGGEKEASKAIASVSATVFKFLYKASK